MHVDLSNSANSNNHQADGFINKVAFDRSPLVVKPTAYLSQVVAWMSQGNRDNQAVDSASKASQASSYCLVMTQRRLLGIFTERDVVRIIAQGVELQATTVAEVMTRNPITVSITELVRPTNIVTLFQ